MIENTAASDNHHHQKKTRQYPVGFASKDSHDLISSYATRFPVA
jgi:hypothetical protein